ncbi:MAG: HAD hydrolase-like protein [Methylophilaceae bacterium]
MSLQLDLTKYKTIVFDADGVILDSNITNIDTYFRTAKKFGASAVESQTLVDYHLTMSGIGSYPKFKWFIETVLEQEATPDRIDEFQDAFWLAVKRGLLSCRLADGLNELRQKTSHANWVVVTETDENQIQTLFKEREIAQLFDGGIFGSPYNKDEILSREKQNGQIKMPALFIGDCQYDYEAATRAGLDFVFVTDWTDVSNWEAFCEQNQIHVCRNIKSL